MVRRRILIPPYGGSNPPAPASWGEPTADGANLQGATPMTTMRAGEISNHVGGETQPVIHRRSAWRSRAMTGLRFPVFVLALIAAAEGYCQTPPGEGQVSTPQSTIEKPGDSGVRAHTNTKIFIPNRGPDGRRAPSRGTDTGAPQGPGLEPARGAARPQ